MDRQDAWFVFSGMKRISDSEAEDTSKFQRTKKANHANRSVGTISTEKRSVVH